MKKKVLIGIAISVVVITAIVIIVLMGNNQSNTTGSNTTSTSKTTSSERYTVRSYATSQKVTFNGPKGYTYNEEDSDRKEAIFEKNVNNVEISLSYQASKVDESSFNAFKETYYTKKSKSNYYKDAKYQENKTVTISDYNVEYAVSSYTDADETDGVICIKILAQAEKDDIYPLKIEITIETTNTKQASNYYSSVEELLQEVLDINAEREV
jgi:hypothetical protein